MNFLIKRCIYPDTITHLSTHIFGSDWKVQCHQNLIGTKFLQPIMHDFFLKAQLQVCNFTITNPQILQTSTPFTQKAILLKRSTSSTFVNNHLLQFAKFNCVYCKHATVIYPSRSSQRH